MDRSEQPAKTEWTIGRKLTVFFAILLGLVFLLSWSSLRSISRLSQALNQVVHSGARKLEAASAMQAAFHRMQSTCRQAQIALILELQRSVGAASVDGMNCVDCHNRGGVDDSFRRFRDAAVAVRSHAKDLRPLASSKEEEESVARSNRGKEKVEEALGAVVAIDRATASIQALVGEVDRRSRDQESRIQEVQRAITPIGGVARQNAQASRETAGSADHLNSHSEALGRAVGELTRLVGAGA
ncbi:MAG: hypothetical protein KIT09_33275 [Bryobacteraceae bacterium]|nr:hypothetical protein [Bryobacteraceae bacterium]